MELAQMRVRRGFATLSIDELGVLSWDVSESELVTGSVDVGSGVIGVCFLGWGVG